MHGVTEIPKKAVAFHGPGGRAGAWAYSQCRCQWKWEEEGWINVHFRDKINLAGFADGIKGDYDGGRKVKDFF